MLFLDPFLFYSAYFMLRYSLGRGGSAALSAVYALFGVVLIPVSFLAVRLARPSSTRRLHARGPQIRWQMLFTFFVCLGGMLVARGDALRDELAGKRLDARLRELREVLAELPPRSTSGRPTCPPGSCWSTWGSSR